MNKKFIFGFTLIFTLFVLSTMGRPAYMPVDGNETVLSIVFSLFYGLVIALVLNGLYLLLRHLISAIGQWILSILQLIFK